MDNIVAVDFVAAGEALATATNSTDPEEVDLNVVLAQVPRKICRIREKKNVLFL